MSDGQIAAALWEEDGDREGAMQLDKELHMHIRKTSQLRCASGRIGLWVDAANSGAETQLARWDAAVVGRGYVVLRPLGGQSAWLKWETPEKRWLRCDEQ